MAPNRFTHMTIGGSYPYVGIQIGYEYDQNTYIQLQGFTDGGGLWRENTFNDWRTLSVVQKIPLNAIKSEFRLGIGLVQTAEKLNGQKSNTFGLAPQIGYAWYPLQSLGISGSWTWPYSPATSLTTGVLIGIEYRMGRYVKENGLHSRGSRPEF